MACCVGQRPQSPCIRVSGPTQPTNQHSSWVLGASASSSAKAAAPQWLSTGSRGASGSRAPAASYMPQTSASVQAHQQAARDKLRATSARGTHSFMPPAEAAQRIKASQATTAVSSGCTRAGNHNNFSRGGSSIGAGATQQGPPVALEQSRLVRGTTQRVNQMPQDNRAPVPVPARVVASASAGPVVRQPQPRTASRGVAAPPAAAAAAATTRVSSPSAPVLPTHTATTVPKGPAAGANMMATSIASGNRTFYAPRAMATASATAAGSAAAAAAATPPKATATAPASKAMKRPQLPRVCLTPGTAQKGPCLPPGATEGVAWASDARFGAVRTGKDAQASPTAASEATLPPTCNGDLGCMVPPASDTTLPPSGRGRAAAPFQLNTDSHDSPRQACRHSIDSQASPAAASDITLPPAWAGMSPDEGHAMPTEDLGAEAAGTGVPMEVRTVLKLLCPDCGADFTSQDDVKNHWLQVHAQHYQSDSTEAAQSMAEDGCQRIVRQICPDCGEAFATLEEAKAHWLQVHQQQQQQQQDEQQQEQQPSISTACDPHFENADEDASAAALQAPELERAQLVEADDLGQPLIVRRTHPETGAASTVVMDPDGSTRSFGSETVKSMTERDESEIASWIQAMKDHHVRGLVNEIRERLYESSGKLHARREELEQLSKQLTFDYFGLSKDAQEKDVDNAYRRLARSMHPDKNGGTTEAKQRFQAMKERYEDLKTQLAAEQRRVPHPQSSEQEECAQDPAAPSEEAHDEEAGEIQKSENREADLCTEENDSRQAGKADPDTEQAESGSERQCGRQSSDANPEMAQANTGRANVARPSRKEAEASAWKMLRQLKMIYQNMKIAESDFQRVLSEVELLRAGP